MSERFKACIPSVQLLAEDTRGDTGRVEIDRDKERCVETRKPAQGGLLEVV
jgi:hypothetical protein